MDLLRFVTNFLEPVACLLYLIVLLIHYLRSKQTAVFPLLGYYGASTILLTIGCLAVNKNSNIWIYDLIALLTAVCMGLYFYRLLQTPGKKRTAVIFVVIYLLYTIIRNLTLHEPRLFDSIGYSLASASVVVYIFMYFHQVLKNVTETSILKELNFWLASGYLIYYVGSFIIFVSYYYLTTKVINTLTKDERALLTALWGLHNVLLFMGALSLLIGSLWIAYRSKSASSS